MWECRVDIIQENTNASFDVSVRRNWLIGGRQAKRNTAAKAAWTLTGTYSHFTRNIFICENVKIFKWNLVDERVCCRSNIMKKHGIEGTSPIPTKRGLRGFEAKRCLDTKSRSRSSSTGGRIGRETDSDGVGNFWDKPGGWRSKAAKWLMLKRSKYFLHRQHKHQTCRFFLLSICFQFQTRLSVCGAGWIKNIIRK